MNSETKITIPISGMTCASCVARVQRAIEKVSGVQSASVNLATESALVTLDPTKAHVEEIERAIRNAGYDIPTEETTIGIEGMSCASCVARVEKALRSVDGIIDARVSLPLENAVIRHRVGGLSAEALQRAVAEAGYNVIGAPDGSARDLKRARDYEKLRFKFIVSAILTVPITVLEMGLMWDYFPATHALPHQTWNYIFFVLTTPILFWGGSQFFVGFWAALRQFTADMNSLVAIGTSAAYVYSATATFFPSLFVAASETPHVYYDTAAVIITLILLGRLLEARAKSRTSEALRKLMELQPKTALVIRDGMEVEIPIDQVTLGDRVVVKPGGRIPVDGTIEKGYSIIDESMVTGESIPVEKSVNDKVIGGTINKSGSFVFRAEKVGRDTVLANIIRLVREAQGSKAPIQKLVDTVASVFVPIVIIIGIASFLGWYFIGPVDDRLTTALLNFVAVLIIACPCALGLATPTAIIVGTGKAAEMGVLIKNSETFEKAKAIEIVIFDKTGTLTFGKPVVTGFQVATDTLSSEQIIRLTASLEGKSEHPLAQAVVQYALQNKIQLSEPDSFDSHSGMGITGTVDGYELIVGNERFLSAHLIEIDHVQQVVEELQSDGKTVIFSAIDRKVAAVIAIADVIKKESKESIHQLRKMGLHVIMLTGDNEATAHSIARELGIDDFRAEVMPHQKAEIVRSLQDRGKVVAMVGDGINDAPALAQADLGIALGTGTDIAMEASDITLVKGDLKGVVRAITISRRTFKTIRQNLFWAFIYNTTGIPLAAFGLLSPMFAAFAMAMSSLSVLTNSLRLKRYNP